MYVCKQAHACTQMWADKGSITVHINYFQVDLYMCSWLMSPVGSHATSLFLRTFQKLVTSFSSLHKCMVLVFLEICTWLLSSVSQCSVLFIFFLPPKLAIVLLLYVTMWLTMSHADTETWSVSVNLKPVEFYSLLIQCSFFFFQILWKILTCSFSIRPPKA